MPTGMETTVKIRIDNFLVTGVVFGNINYQIDQKVRLNLTTDRINLFSKVNQKRIVNGKIE